MLHKRMLFTISDIFQGTPPVCLQQQLLDTPALPARAAAAIQVGYNITRAGGAVIAIKPFSADMTCTTSGRSLEQANLQCRAAEPAHWRYSQTVAALLLSGRRQLSFTTQSTRREPAPDPISRI
jgi:uncharacterized protein (DUF2147 family)